MLNGLARRDRIPSTGAMPLQAEDHGLRRFLEQAIDKLEIEGCIASPVYGGTYVPLCHSLLSTSPPDLDLY
jgi:hypothetical protein